MKLTSLLSSGRFIVFVLAILLLSSCAHAQEFTEEQFEAWEQARTDTAPAIILADIGIYDAKVVSKDETTITITFDIANNADASQSDIKYGIDIIKASANGQTIIDTLVSNETLTLAGHETQSKTLSYTIPSFLSGEYEIWLISRTTGGLMLGLSSVGTTTITQASPSLELVPDSCTVTVRGETETYTLYQGVDVAPEETLSLSCTVMNSSSESITVTPVFETHRRTMYGELITTPASEETITLKENEEKTVAFVIPKTTTPQSYDVSMHLMDTETKQPLSNKIVAHYVLRGGSATIQQITLDKDAYAQGDTLTADIFWSPSADGFPDARGGTGTDIGNVTLSMSVTSEDGTACIEPVTHTLSPIQMQSTLTAPVIALCTSPEASFTLMDGTGNTLDSRTIESPVPEPVIPTNTETPVTTPFWNMLNLAILLATLSSLIILFVVIRMLRHARNTTSYMKGPTSTILKTLILTVITGASMFGGVQEVGAVTFRDYTLDRDRNPPFVMYRNTYTASANKTTYYPGEIITLSGSALSTMCANNGGFPFTLRQELDGVSSYIINNNIVGGVTFYKTIQTTAPLKTGNYAINLTGCWPWAIATFSAGYYYCGTASIPITVTAPAVNCVGSWSDNGMCSVSGACGQTGTVQQTFTQTTPASGGGASCTSIYGGENGAVRWGSTACSTALCPASCPAGTTKSWTVGANTCNGSTPGVASDSNGTVIDSTAPTTGSAAYLCTNGSWAPSPNAGATCAIPATPPTPPTSLTATAGGCSSNRIDLTWPSVSGASGYDLQIDGGIWQSLGNVLSYAHTGLSAGSSHTYNVRAWNVAGAGTSRASTPSPQIAPAACVAPPSASCTGSTFTHSTLCPSDDTDLSGDTPRTLLTTPSCTATKCEYYCSVGYRYSGGSCVATQCNDGIDNADTEDTLIDLADPGCGGNPADNNESNPPEDPILSVNKLTVEKDDTVTLTWDTKNGNEASCTLNYSGGVDLITVTTVANPSTGSTNVTIPARRTYTLSCPNPSGGAPLIDSVSVDIVPVGTET